MKEQTTHYQHWGSTRNQTANDVQINQPDLYECKRCKKQYIGETKSTLRERFTEHRQATNNPSHANVSAAVPTHLTYLITLSKT